LEELYSCLTPENAALVYFTVCNIETMTNELTQVCLRFIRENVQEVIKSKNIDILPKELVLDILKFVVIK